MKKKVIKITVVVVVIIVAIIAVQKLMREIDLRITGVTGEVFGKYYTKIGDLEVVHLSLVLEKWRCGGESDWWIKKQIEVVVRVSPEVNKIKEGQWVRVVKEGKGFWHLAKKL